MTFWAGCTKGSANQWLVQRYGIAGAIAYSIDVDKQRYQRGGEVDQAVLEVREGDLGRDGLGVLSRSHDASLQTSWAHQNYRGSRGSRGKGSDVALLGGASWLLDATPFPSRSRGSSHVPSVTSPSALTFGRRPRETPQVAHSIKQRHVAVGRENAKRRVSSRWNGTSGNAGGCPPPAAFPSPPICASQPSCLRRIVPTAVNCISFAPLFTNSHSASRLCVPQHIIHHGAARIQGPRQLRKATE